MTWWTFFTMELSFWEPSLGPPILREHQNKSVGLTVQQTDVSLSQRQTGSTLISADRGNQEERSRKQAESKVAAVNKEIQQRAVMSGVISTTPEEEAAAAG